MTATSNQPAGAHQGQRSTGVPSLENGVISGGASKTGLARAEMSRLATEVDYTGPKPGITVRAASSLISACSRFVRTMLSSASTSRSMSFRVL